MSKSTYSMGIVDVISDFLNKTKCKFSFNGRRGQFKFDVNLSGKIKKINYIINVREGQYTVYAVSTIRADGNNREMMTAMAEFVCRANNNLANGNFELDMQNGEIRYKRFVDCDGITLTTEMVKNSICAPGVVIDYYGAGIMDIILGHATAKEAVERCERPSAEERNATFGEWADKDDSEDEEIERIFARLEKRLGHSRNEVPKKVPWDAGVPEHIRTNLFGTKGGTD